MHNQTKSQEANRLIVASYPEGLLNEVLYGKSPPRGSDPPPLYIPLTPFVYLLLINGTPSFPYLIYNFASLFQSFKYDFSTAPRGGTWVFFGWVCAARDSKLAPRSKKISPKTDTPF